MDIKNQIKFVKEQLTEAQEVVTALTILLTQCQSDINNHVYESIEKAEGFLYNQFDNEAADDCEGSGNCGCEEYTQDFIVDGKEYTAIGKFEYDRHDKQFYYVDSSEYSYLEKV